MKMTAYIYNFIQNHTFLIPVLFLPSFIFTTFFHLNSRLYRKFKLILPSNKLFLRFHVSNLILFVNFQIVGSILNESIFKVNNKQNADIIVIAIFLLIYCVSTFLIPLLYKSGSKIMYFIYSIFIMLFLLDPSIFFFTYLYLLFIINGILYFKFLNLNSKLKNILLHIFLTCLLSTGFIYYYKIGYVF